MKMVVKDGIQYRPEDAERLGIKSESDSIDVADAGEGRVIRAGERPAEASNKARTVVSTGTVRPTSVSERKAAEKAAAEERARIEAAADGTA